MIPLEFKSLSFPSIFSHESSRINSHGNFRINSQGSSRINSQECSRIYSHGSKFISENSNSINKTELLFALNGKPSNENFHSCLSDKLMQNNSISDPSTIIFKDLISQISDYEESFKKSSEALINQNSKENEKCQNRNQSKNINNENFFENSRLSGQIIGIDLKKTMEGIKEINEIIIKIKCGEQVQEVIQKTGFLKEEKEENNCFEFQSIKKEEYLEFILQVKNKSGDIINIGSKAYSLEGITILKKYSVLIDIPEAFKEGKESNKMGEIIFAEIMMNFSLTPSYYKYYELQTRKEEPELKKINIDVKQDEEYAKTNQDIFGGKIENINFRKTQNKESLTKMNKLENDRNIIEFSMPFDFKVEFNNVRYDNNISKGFELKFNNILEVKSSSKILPSNKVEKNQLNEEQNEQLKKSQPKEPKNNKKQELEKINERVNEIENISQKKNELVEQKENIEVRMDEQQYNDLINSESQKINIKEPRNLDVNNINSECIQKPDINTGSMENYSNNDEINENENKNKVLVEENILSLEYLPEKDNKVIAYNNAYSLSPYTIEIQDPFILNMEFNDKINIKFIIKINININIINKI